MVMLESVRPVSVVAPAAAPSSAGPQGLASVPNDDADSDAVVSVDDPESPSDELLRPLPHAPAARAITKMAASHRARRGPRGSGTAMERFPLWMYVGSRRSSPGVGWW